MATYNMIKRTIENQLEKGILDKASMTAKLDVFLLCNRIAEEQYLELSGMLGE